MSRKHAAHSPPKTDHAPSRVYDREFRASESYKATLPDMQNQDASRIQGSNVPIIQVGISNFRLPLTFLTREGKKISLETSVTGTVTLAADHKGINMSRIMRVFYEYQDRVFTPEVLDEVLHAYKKELGSSRARLRLEFNYPLMKNSLRSNLRGWQYYRCCYEGRIDDLDRVRRYIHFDFVYSSACPCSGELSEHARETRQVFGIPHSQRSKARVVVEIADGAHLAIEDVREHCLNALQTETQVMVKREDEQAFAELNGAYMKFVEDAARLIHEALDSDPRIRDFQAACAHLESLHSHDAVAVINKGLPGGLSAEFEEFKNLIC